MSQPTPDDQVRLPDPDPLLEFFAEPELEPPAVAAAPADVPPEPVVNAIDPVPPPVLASEPEPDPELRRRLDRTERMLEKAQIEISTIKSDVATLVSAIDDIKKRQSRPVTLPPAPPINTAPPRISRVAAAAVTAIGVILVVVVWGMWSLASYDVPELEAEVGAAAQPASEPPAPTATALAQPVEIKNAAAVSVVEPAREEPAPAPRDLPVQAARADRSDRVEREPRPETAAYVGTLSIDASPGGEVFLNRKSVGRTPLRLEGLRAGSHLIWIERDGFQRWTRVVLVAANRVSRVSAELAPLR